MAIVTRFTVDGKPRYQVKVKDPKGNWYETSTFSTIREAQAEEEYLFSLKMKGSVRKGVEGRQYTVQEFWEVWSEVNRQKVSAGWKISQNQMYRAYIAPHLGSLKVGEVDKSHIGKVLQSVRDLGRSEQTVKHVYSLLRSMFSDARDFYDMISECPVSPKHHRPKVLQAKRNFLEPQASWNLLESCKEEYFGPAVWLGVLSGLRISEIQALKGEHLHFQSGQILVCSAFNNKTGKLQNYPKEGDWEYVPMPPVLAEYLAGLEREPWDFVVQNVKGGMLPYETFRRCLWRACEKAKVKWLNPHELRHSSTELYVQAGASAEDIRRLLKHKSLTSTKHYIHRTDARLAQLASAIGPDSNVVSFPKSFPNGKKEAFCTPEKGEQNAL